MLVSPGNRVSDIVSDEVVKIPITDGVCVGSKISFTTASGEVEGVVIQYNSKTATVALTGGNRGSISRSNSFSIKRGSLEKFRINRVPFTKSSDPVSPNTRLISNIPSLDMLLNEKLKSGSTIAIYSPTLKPGKVSFPSNDQPTTAIEMYLDLVKQANAALERSKNESITLVCDFRKFADACRSLEFQAGCVLPSSPQSLVASVLQLAHTNDSGHALSVIALFNERADFGSEASRSVDVAVDLASDSSIANLKELLTGYSLKEFQGSLHDQLIGRVVQGLRFSEELAERQKMGIFVDDWEEDERESISSLIKLLPVVSEAFSKTENVGEQRVLVRALTTMFFNKTGKRHSAAVIKFPGELIEAFRVVEPELLEILAKETNVPLEFTLSLDHALMKLRYRFELTNPLAAL